MKITKAIKEDTATIKNDTAAIREDLRQMPEHTAAAVVKSLKPELREMEGNLLDATTSLERNITKNVVEQVCAVMAAYHGPMPHPGSTASSSRSALDRKVINAAKLHAGAENAAKAKAAKK